MKKSLYLVVFVFGLLFLNKPVFAAVRCETQYGGNQICVTTGQLQIDKEVWDPQNNRYVDNLGINDYKFAPSELISFRLSIKNVGDATLSKVTVSDNPQAGFFDLATGALNFDLNDLAPGETRQQEIKLRVVDTNNLPQNNIVCVINTAEANADNSHDKDTAQICLERKVLAAVTKGGLPVEVKELPKTGPEGWLFTLFGSVSALAAGSRLVKVGRIGNEAENEYQITVGMINKKRRGV